MIICIYHRATRLVAVVLVENTLTTFTGTNVPAGNAENTTSSPDRDWETA